MQKKNSDTYRNAGCGRGLRLPTILCAISPAPPYGQHGPLSPLSCPHRGCQKLPGHAHPPAAPCLGWAPCTWCHPTAGSARCLSPALPAVCLLRVTLCRHAISRKHQPVSSVTSFHRRHGEVQNTRSWSEWALMGLPERTNKTVRGRRKAL